MMVCQLPLWTVCTVVRTTPFSHNHAVSTRILHHLRCFQPMLFGAYGWVLLGELVEPVSLHNLLCSVVWSYPYHQAAAAAGAAICRKCKKSSNFSG